MNGTMNQLKLAAKKLFEALKVHKGLKGIDLSCELLLVPRFRSLFPHFFFSLSSKLQQQTIFLLMEQVLLTF
jgi:hypothetical protein